MRVAYATSERSSEVDPAFGSDALGPSALGGGGFGGHGAGSTAAEVAFGLEYDGARGAVTSIAPRGVDTRPHGSGTHVAYATSGRSSDAAPAPGGDAHNYTPPVPQLAAKVDLGWRQKVGTDTGSNWISA